MPHCKETISVDLLSNRETQLIVQMMTINSKSILVAACTCYRSISSKKSCVHNIVKAHQLSHKPCTYSIDFQIKQLHVH